MVAANLLHCMSPCPNPHASRPRKMPLCCPLPTPALPFHVPRQASAQRSTPRCWRWTPQGSSPWRSTPATCQSPPSCPMWSPCLWTSAWRTASECRGVLQGGVNCSGGRALEQSGGTDCKQGRGLYVYGLQPGVLQVSIGVCCACEGWKGVLQVRGVGGCTASEFRSALQVEGVERCIAERKSIAESCIATGGRGVHVDGPRLGALQWDWNIPVRPYDTVPSLVSRVGVPPSWVAKAHL